MEKRDPLLQYRGAKPALIVQDKPHKHDEADLHLKFCKWIKKNYPNDQFIRHEREKQRSVYMQNLMKCYNSELDKMPDFELLEPSGAIYPFTDRPKPNSYHYFTLHRLYIEFKAPGTILTLKDGITIKPAYADQYRRHLQFFLQGSPAYFCSDFDEACRLFIAYKAGNPLPMQVFEFRNEPIIDLPF